MTAERTSARWPRRVTLAGALVIAAGLIAGLAWTLARRAERQPHNILVIAIDSLRRDRVGAYGSPRRLTPFLDELAARSTVYDNAYAPSSWTIPTVASIFTGRYPSEHQTVTFLAPLQESETTLAEVLLANGYATSMVTANAAIRAAGGFAQGFERHQLVGEPTMENPKSDGELVNQQTLEWVDEVGRERPHFLYLHYMDVHAPYRSHDGLTPPRSAALQRPDAVLNLAATAGAWEKNPQVRQSFWNFTPAEVWRLEDLYDSEVRYEDTLLRRLFDGLAARGFLDNALVVVTADHGEEFGRHGAFNHGTSLYGALIHVPLIIRFPHQPAQRVEPLVQLAGLGAMIMDAVGIPPPPSFGVGWLPTQPEQWRQASAFSELLETGQYQVWSHKRTLISPTSKVIVTSDNRYIAYDLDTDPLERFPQPVEDARRSAIDARVDAMQTGRVAPAVEIDSATRERLRAAGYLVDKP